MSKVGKVIAVNISEQKGMTKHPVNKALVDKKGIAGDAHAGNWHRQISLLDQNSIAKFSGQFNRNINPGEFAENITISGIDLSTAAVLDRFCIGEIELEVTQIGKQCHGDKCAIYQEVGNCVMPKEGIFCRVIHGGGISQGDTIEYIPRALRIQIITLSDRAFAGIYDDRSGPVAKQILANFFTDKRWHWQIDTTILPDDARELGRCLQDATAKETDIIFTLGGTGVGPKDIVPEVVISVCDKIIPGIMENIRGKYGSDKPAALLSRSTAGVINKTQIYALPGSVTAVQEYLQEILKTLEHTIFMLHDIDIH